MPYVLSRFGFNEMMDCRGRLRDLLADDPATLEDAAERAVEFFHQQFVDDAGRPACALVRFFKTHPYGDLSEDLRAVALETAPEAQSVPELRCLTLVATRGDEPQWNSRQASRGHRVIPLMSVEMVQQAPMLSQLITQLGLPINAVVRPSRALMLDPSETHNVFYVARAAGSPHIVAQEEFVIPYGIESVLGFGGLLSSGDLFAMVLFSRVFIPPTVADQFRVVGLNLKIAVLPFARKPVFREE
jgi:two-component system NtrC family sensor kinase